jgi:hypothetical protein
MQQSSTEPSTATSPSTPDFARPRCGLLATPTSKAPKPIFRQSVGRATYIDQAAASDARGVIIQLGINDIASGTNQNTLRTRIAATMDKLKDVACVGWPTYPTKITGSYIRVAALAPILNGMIRDAAATRPWMHVIEFGPAMDADVARLRSGDGLHPTAAGYQLLANFYFTALVTDCQPR